jgi:hypothetical protein
MRAAEPDPGLHHRMVSARVAVIDEEAHLSEALLNRLHRSWDWLVREHVDKRNCSRQEPRASEHAQSRAAALRSRFGAVYPLCFAELLDVAFPPLLFAGECPLAF